MKGPRLSPLALLSALALIGLNLACLGWNLQSSRSDSPLRNATSWRPETNLELASGEHIAVGKADPAILARPIFFRERRPYTPPPAPPAPPQTEPVHIVAAPPPPPSPPDFTVSGVTLTDGVKQAYVKFTPDSGGAWFREGEHVMGWHVVNVTGTGLVVTKDGRAYELSIYETDRAE